MTIRDTRNIEKNISFCTFRLGDINSLVRILILEKEKALVELKRIYELSLPAKDVSINNAEINYSQQGDKVIKNLKQIEDELKIEKGEFFSKQIQLSFTIINKRKTISGTDWEKVLRESNRPVKAVLVKFNCPTLKRKITFSIKERFDLNDYSFDNLYEIYGEELNWIEEVNLEIEKLLESCKNKRGQFYNRKNFFELIFSLIFAGSIFLSFGMIILLFHLNSFVSNLNVAVICLLGILLYIFIWIFGAIGFSTKLFEYVSMLFPSVEIAINEARIRKRKNLCYVAFIVIVPYILNLFYVK